MSHEIRQLQRIEYSCLLDFWQLYSFYQKPHIINAPIKNLIELILGIECASISTASLVFNKTLRISKARVVNTSFGSSIDSGKDIY